MGFDGVGSTRWVCGVFGDSPKSGRRSARAPRGWYKGRGGAIAYTSRVERGLAKDDADEGSVKREGSEAEDGVRGDGDDVEEEDSTWAGGQGEVSPLSMGSSWMVTGAFGSLKENGANSTEGER
jgi:hypothetical protein